VREPVLQKRLPKLPRRPADGHKGTFGKVLIIGGSEGMIGAPAFCGQAALRMGCGLAYVATPREILPFVISITPELVGIALGGKGNSLFEKSIESCDAVAIGPGLGRSSLAVKLLKKAMKTPAPLLIDADGLNLIAAGKVKLARKPRTVVLTPHPGEMARLARLFGRGDVPSDEPGRIEIATQAARFFRQIVILKGAQTVIADGERCAINTTGDSTLAKAGSGDILSGMIATLLGQKMDPFDAAWAGCHYHGRAGEFAGQEVGQRCGLARDVIDAIPYVLR
jgi:hydroxyethylthiazole kinase-like uncharacterized protein yjeF